MPAGAAAPGISTTDISGLANGHYQDVLYI